VPTKLGELVKILDFGIAKIRDDSAEYTNLTRTFLGTFRYASPEQLEMAKDMDGRADIYSLGIILYEMLSGTDPFGLGTNSRSTTGVAWARAHTSMPPVLLRSQPGLEQLSLELEAVVMRCLQKAPNERFASVDELNRALQSAASGIGDSNIQRLLNLSGRGSNDDTVNRPLAVGRAVPDATIFQPPPAAPGSNDDTINRPLAAGQGVPDATIAQIPLPPRQGHADSHIPLPLNPPVQEVPDATIAQIPVSPGQIPDATIAQIPPSLGQGVPDATIPQAPRPSERASRSLPTQLLLPLGAGFAIGLAVMGGIYTYLQLQPHETPVLDEIKNLETQGKYEDCIAKAETVRQDSSLYTDAQKLLNQCQLEYAKQSAVGKNFTGAIAAAKKIPENSPLHQEAQVLIEQWSKQVDNSI